MGFAPENFAKTSLGFGQSLGLSCLSGISDNLRGCLALPQQQGQKSYEDHVLRLEQNFNPELDCSGITRGVHLTECATGGGRRDRVGGARTE